jgi:dihydropteroate synthase
MADSPALVCRGHVLDTSGPLVMGIVNATPDSFSDEVHRTTVDAQLAQALELLDAGADLLDVGGQSGITGVPEISEDEEIARVLPLVEAVLAARPDAVLSVDTYRPPVVRAVVEAGAAIVNDVSGLRYPEILEPCAATGCGVVIMHTLVEPKKKLTDPALYGDVTGEVAAMLERTWAAVRAAGVADEAVVLDPGIDYAKTPAQSVTILRELDRLWALGRPLLLALSRKDFIGALTATPPRRRLAGTLAAIGQIGRHPGAIYRVHDVADVRNFLAVQAVLQGHAEVPADLLLDPSLRREPDRRS